MEGAATSCRSESAMAVAGCSDAPGGIGPCHSRDPSMEKHVQRVLDAQRGEQDSETRENTMMKQIDVHGQQVNLYSPDGGCTWSSNPQSIVAYGRRKKRLRLELQNGFARIDEMRDLDPDNFTDLHTPKRLTKANKKNQAHNIVGKVRLARLALGCAVSEGYPRRWAALG